MTALILVVDDLEPNVKLLEAKLTNEYYDVITASNGFEAIEQAKEHSPDIILLDVMMPEMDGFEACQKLKADPKTSHIPVVMVTALSEPSDRIRGLECGADDFITKPIKEIQLMARVKSLVRIKMLIDELRLRGQTSAEIGDLTGEDMESLMRISGCSVAVIDDDAIQGKNIKDRLDEEGLTTTLITDPDQTIPFTQTNEVDLFVVSTQLGSMDGLRLCSQLRSMDETRHIPELIIVDEDDERRLVKGLEMGVNDYLITPVDVNELMCRVRTNIRRKKYKDALKANYKQSVNMAITDGLTGVYNRHYLTVHLEKQLKSALEKQKPLSFIIIDADHFKNVNDSYGHDVGDEVLKELATRMVNQTRGSDMVARFGGEEFVMLMPGLGMPTAVDVAERIRASVELIPFKVSHEIEQLDMTVSVGVATVRPGDTAETILKRADTALYEAKHGGRNRVVIAEDDAMISTAMQQKDAADHSPIESDERETEAAAPIVDVNALPRDEEINESDESASVEPTAPMDQHISTPIPSPAPVQEVSTPSFSEPTATPMPEIRTQMTDAPVAEQPIQPHAPAAPQHLNAEPTANMLNEVTDKAEPASTAPMDIPAPQPVEPALTPPSAPAVETIAEEPTQPTPVQEPQPVEPEPVATKEIKTAPAIAPKAAPGKSAPVKKPSLFSALTGIIKKKDEPTQSESAPVEPQPSVVPAELPAAQPAAVDTGRPPPENAKVVKVQNIDEEDKPDIPGLKLKQETVNTPPPLSEDTAQISDLAHSAPTPTATTEVPTAHIQPTVAEPQPTAVPPREIASMPKPVTELPPVDHLSLGEAGNIIQDDNGEKKNSPSES